MRVLIVEDELLVALDMERTLEDLGFEVVGVACDERQAMMLAAHGCDVALVDLNLRDGLTGLPIARALTESGVSVVFLTGNPGAVDTTLGAVGMISKPVTGEDVRQTADFLRGLRAGETPRPPHRLRLLQSPADAR